MQIVVLCSQAQKEELLQGWATSTAELLWVSELNEILEYKSANAVIDLLFENGPERVNRLSASGAGLIIINSVIHTLTETNETFIRIAGWNTFLKSTIVEGSLLNGAMKDGADAVFAQLGKGVQWLPDVPGLVTPRVLSMIINEAYLAVEEGVSTPEQINTAMKLGTAYPYGPIEWGNLIGLKNVVSLLQKFAVTQPRYTPAPLLLAEAAKVT